MCRFVAVLVLLGGAAAVRAQPALPRWLDLGGEIRGRAESNTAIGFVPGNDDTYYLHRLRAHFGVQPAPWFRVYAEAQDAHAPGYDQRPLPATVEDTFDLRQAYVQVGSEKSGWSLRAGRQELIFGEERLVGAANWGNVGRTFDAARLMYRRGGVRLDWFASVVVPAITDRFDRPAFTNKLHGFYTSLGDPGKIVAEPYFLWKVSPGDLYVYTFGGRSVAKLPARIDYDIEVAGQRGHVANSELRAWAGHWQLGYTLPGTDRTPRLVAEYNRASGDRNPRDNVRGTFDQLYPTNHDKYGTADRIGWRNMHDAMAAVKWNPHPKWRVSVDYHRFFLASRQDWLYTDSGAPVLRNPNARSSRIGDEIDVYGFYQPSKALQFGAGYARLFAGSFLKQSGRPGDASYPYFLWLYRL